MKTTRVDSMNIFLLYIEAIEQDVQLQAVNYKVIAVDLYVEYCDRLFFVTMTDCKHDFYKDIINKEFDDIMKELSQKFNEKISKRNEAKVSNITILIEDKNDSRPIQSLKDNGYLLKLYSIITLH